MKIGIDAVEILEISKKITASDRFLNNLLYPEEINNSTLETICGKIAAKEAIVKTGFLLPSYWKKIKILPSSSGTPQAFSDADQLISNIHLSISHTKSLAIAVAIYE